jgi:hypothetical protein
MAIAVVFHAHSSHHQHAKTKLGEASVTPNTFGSVIFLRSVGQIARQSDRRAALLIALRGHVEPAPPFRAWLYGFQLKASYKVTKSPVGIEGIQHSNQKKGSAA